MKTLVCGVCHKTYPMNDMFSVLNRTLCEACGNQELESRKGQKLPE